MGGETAVEAATEAVNASAAGGFEALSLAAGRLGFRMSADRLNRSRGQNRSAITPNELVRIGGNAGLRMKRVRLTWQHLSRLGRAFSLLLRLDDGQSLVAERFLTLGGTTPVVMVLDPLHPEAPALAIDEIRLAGAWSGE